jgi:hypothetical protein
MISRGLALGLGQVFDLEKPFALGGEFTPDNIKPLDAVAHFSLLGQLHQKLRGAPLGTKISGVTSELRTAQPAHQHAARLRRLQVMR